VSHAWYLQSATGAGLRQKPVGAWFTPIAAYTKHDNSMSVVKENTLPEKPVQLRGAIDEELRVLAPESQRPLLLLKTIVGAFRCSNLYA